MNKNQYRSLRVSNVQQAAIRKLHYVKPKSKPNSNDPVIVIDDTSDNRVERPKPSGPKKYDSGKDYTGSRLEDNFGQKNNSLLADQKRKKLKMTNNKYIVINVDNQTEKKSESETRYQNQDQDRYYKTNFADVDPVAYYNQNNPGKTFEEYMQEQKKTQEPGDLTEEDHELITKMLKEFYQENSESYNICKCEHCSYLTLPFLVRKDVLDPQELKTIQIKHSEYYKKHLPEADASNHNQNVHINNLFFKKVHLGEVKCKLITN